MANSLGLDDDLDGVELVQDVKQAFGIEIANDEAEQMLTVGQLYDLVLTKIPPNEADRKYATAMAFYRLRRVIRTLGYKAPLSPSTDLSFLRSHGGRTSLRRLEKPLGLKLPPLEMTVVGSMGCLAVGICFCILLGISVVSRNGLFSGWAVIGACAVLIVVLWAIVRFDPGKLPASCSTLGDLATKVAARNFGRLVELGARHADREVWKNLIELLSGYALPSSEIRRDTVFLQSQLTTPK